ncbi:MAG: hypothetical protein WBO37_13115 [Gammaproteobacteria bacterium]
MKILIRWHEAFRWFLVLALAGYAIWAWNAEAGDVAVPQPSITGDFESLRSLLETRGWRIERTPDGSTLLFPLQDTPPAVEAGDVTVRQPLMTGDFDNLRSLLETRGWRVERAPDGSTLLFPLRETPPAQEPAPASITLTVSSENMQQLHELLEAYGWNLVQEGSNALHLLAPAHPLPLPAATKADCAEEQKEFLFTAGVKLPVNTIEEAWQISTNWLWESGYTELGVGDIRNINWIYLVKIVDQIPPYRLRNELIINKRSGQLLPLY